MTQAKKEKKDQFVIAWMGNLEHPERVVSHACFLAHMLQKGVILLYVVDKRYKSISKDIAEQKLQAIRSHINDLNDVTYCAMEGDSKQVADLLPTMLNGVIVVAGVDATAPRRTVEHPKEVLRVFEECKIAFLTVQQPLSQPELMSDIAFSVDFHKESKEKLVWASYYARFAGSRMHVLSSRYSDEGLQAKWYNNIKFMTKFFNSLNLSCQLHEVEGRSTFAETLMVEYAVQQHYGLLISVTTDLRNRDALELIIGTQEQRTIQNKDQLPVLFLNPRDDIYVLCD